MPALTLTTIDGATATVEHRHPRQSEVLATMASTAGVDRSVPGELLRATHSAALDLLSSLITSVTVGGATVTTPVRTWIDEHVSYGATVDAANAVLAARLPTQDVAGKSPGGADS